MAKVLVVDDSLSVRRVVEKALQAHSVHVLSAASGAEAIDRIEQEQPDVVVCDVVLPDKDGYQICEYIRSHPVAGRTPVLLISGVVNGTVLSRAAEVQSNDVMFKPFAADELVRKIDSLLGTRNGGGNGSPPPDHAATAEGPRPAAPVSDRATDDAGGVRSPEPRRTTGAVTLEQPGPAPSINGKGHAASGWSAEPRRPAPPPRSEAPSPPRAPATAETELATADGLKGRLAWLIAASGAKFAALADREGFLIEFAGEIAFEVEVAGALASCLAESSDGIGRELKQGALLGMILEYEGGMLLLSAVGSSALLAVILGEAAVLGKTRYYIKKVLPELQRAL
jgi:CheY-like chemotaxis protein